MSQVEVNKEQRGFQSEIKQLLDLMIHSLYSHPEIFLRELISNAADAAEKLRVEALADDALYEGAAELGIAIDFSDTLHTITIRDNGIGMSRDEVVANLGTIARSGTKEFVGRITGDQKQDAELIGQFGVGFYSAFIVAEKVSVSTRRAGLPPEQGVIWESDGQGEYSVRGALRKKRGTEIVLHLRGDHHDLAGGYRLREIIRKYSDHIAQPIRMPPLDEKKTEPEVVNKATALWTRNKKDITDEEYNEFYKHIGHDFDDPLARVHTRAEGKLEYITLFYIPPRAPFDLWERADHRRGVKLYVKRVFILEDTEALLPRYLRFVRGVVDSADLPLNVSREILQQNKTLETIRAASTKKILGLLESLTDKPDYPKIWELYGRVLKEGIIEDHNNQALIAKLLRFSSTQSDIPAVSLSDYLARMPAGQQAIYYLTGESLSAVRHSPHLEVFAKKGLEVLLLTDPVDEWLVNHLTEFEGKKLLSAAKGDLDLGGLADADPVKADTSSGSDHTDLLQRLRAALKDRAHDVRITQRLTESPACLVAQAGDLGGNFERILRATGQPVESKKPILEINPEHGLIRRMQNESEAVQFSEWAQVIFDQALLAEGGRLPDPASFVRRLNRLLQSTGNRF